MDLTTDGCEFLKVLNNREIAGLIWLSVAACYFLPRVLRKSNLRALIQAFFVPSIIIALSTMFIWIGLELWVGSMLSIWEAALTKPTLIWAIGSGGVLFFKCQSAGSKPHFVRQTMMGTVGVVLFVQYFMNLHSMSLLAELLLQGLILAATLMMLVTGRRPEYRRVERFLELLHGLVVLSLIAYSARQLYLDRHETQLSDLALEFVLPIWLTLGLLPYIYLLAAVLAYEQAFRLLNSFHPNRRAHWLAHASLLVSFRFSVRQLRKFRNYWLNQLSQTSNITQTRRVIGEFRRHQAKIAEEIVEEERRLSQFAGSDATDTQGRRLDRREFKETISALQHLHSCQMGWFGNHGGRYRIDLLSILDNNFSHHGLSRDHGITLCVSSDGQAWYAWRRTVSNWCFAIGATGPPTNLWEYDGANPPTGFPGECTAWGTGPFSDEANANWR
ncbi:MAG: hypothetical protein F4109_03575 [Gammaproteobacteria bacterium]|nr:hypothetical protein [Gammaproteobacteria bacterium]MYD00993.1 hypothetical protein [Gammaproteobacteria bacterium]MYI24497.1 hypothetical protein [Gammaproteobacteria bacterium]